ncbi:MAG: hypothetical protein ACKVX7_02390 [Planctomycetota bacterium]
MSRWRARAIVGWHILLWVGEWGINALLLLQFLLCRSAQRRRFFQLILRSEGAR